MIAKEFGLELEAHRGEEAVLRANIQVASMYGIPYVPSPEISQYLEEGDKINFEGIELECLFTPGHSPASLCFVDHQTKQVIGGDVLFLGSIGRTDLPGGSYQVLIESIQTKLMSLEDDYSVYSGHGPATTIGHERRTNPFLNT